MQRQDSSTFHPCAGLSLNWSVGERSATLPLLSLKALHSQLTSYKAEMKGHQCSSTCWSLGQFQNVGTTTWKVLMKKGMILWIAKLVSTGALEGNPKHRTENKSKLSN